MSLPEFEWSQIKQHNSEKDLWIVINNKVYDITSFLKVHPGGKGVLLPVGGSDCTKQFYSLHQEVVLERLEKKLLIGTVKGEKVIEYQQRDKLSMVPYAEPSYFTKKFHSPYFNDSHLNFKLELRKFFVEKILPYSDQWEENGQEPDLNIYKEMGKRGILACCIAPGEHLKEYQLPAHVDWKQFDYFHELITHQEFFRLGAPGVSDALKTGLVIGLPPVLKFGQPSVRERVVRECLNGEKRICLAISDENAGSDVAGLTCVAKKSECGQFYIVNGTKKWITNGTFCDFFVTAVRTGGKGTGGISMLLIERGPGVQTKLIKTSYSWCAGTAYVTYTNVQVPVQNLLGQENKGFEIIMSNFNHERWMMCAQVTSASRFILEQCFKWTNQREAFGKKLIQQPVIRNKLAHMVAQIESCENWLESITYQMTKMNDSQQYKHLGGPIALLKLQCTRMSCFISDNACQIFGGRAITRTGMGMYVERFQKSFKFTAIYGGSEEIMADLGIKQAMRNFPENAKL